MIGSITVEAKIVGKPRKLFSDWLVPIPPSAASGSGRITLRDLITWIVSEEVAAFTQRQEQRRLEHVLSKTDIQQGAARGKIDMGGQDSTQSVDPHQAAAVALQAFEDGLYFVFVDEQQVLGLDDAVYISPDTHVLFLRLVALVGG